MRYTVEVLQAWYQKEPHPDTSILKTMWERMKVGPVPE